MKTGFIYKIENLKNNKIYIGSTVDLKARKRRHFFELKNKTHHSSHLQYSYNKYGKDLFKFSEICRINFEDKNDLFDLEIYYIKKFNSDKRTNGYNMSIPVKNGGSKSKHLCRPILELDQSGSIANNYESVSEAVRETGLDNRKIFAMANGKLKYYNNSKFIYKEDYDKSKDYSFEPYDRSKTRYGKKVNKYSLEGKFIQTYDKISEAELDNNMKPMLISSVLNGNQKSSGGFLWRYYENNTDDLEIKYTDIAKIRNPNVYQFDKDGSFIAEYNVKTLPKEFKMKGVRKCIYGERPTYKNYIWRNNKNMLLNIPRKLAC